MQFLQVQTETFLFVLKEISRMYGMAFEDFKDHMVEFAHQVEDHILLLEEVKTKIVQNTRKKDEVHHPVVKYKSPDAWYQPRASLYCNN